MRRVTLLVSLALLVNVFMGIGVAVSGDGIPWPQGWTHVGLLIVHNPGATNLYNVTIPVDIDFTDQVNKGYVRTDLADVRFTDASGVFLPYNYTGQTGYEGHFIVRFPVLAPGDNAFYIFYGNPGAYYASFNETLVPSPVSVTVYNYTLDTEPPSASYRYVNQTYISVTYGSDGMTVSASGGGGVVWLGFPPVTGFNALNVTVEASFTGSASMAGVGFNGDGYSYPYYVDVVTGTISSSTTHLIRRLSSLDTVDYTWSISSEGSLVSLVMDSTGDTHDSGDANVKVDTGYDLAKAAPGLYFYLDDGESVTATGFKVEATGYPGYTVLLELVSGDVVYQPAAPNVNASATGNISVGGWRLGFPSWLEEYRGEIALLISVIPLLLATEGTAPVAVAASAGLLMTFTASGWTSAKESIIGLSLVVAGIGLALQRKNS